MNPDDPGLEQVLAERGEGVRVVADLAQRAIARDRSNRRRELGAAALAAGLVLAVAVPVAWSAVRPTGERPLPVGPSESTTAPTGRPSTPTGTPSTAPTPTAIPTLSADGAPVPTVRLATGEPTATTNVPYLADGVIHDGTQQIALTGKLTGGSLSRLAGGRWLVAQGETGVHYVVSRAGATVVRLDGETSTVNADGSVFVIESRGSLTAYDAAGKRLRRLASTTCDCTPDGVSDAESPGYDAVGIVGAVVYANRGYTGRAVAWDVAAGTRRDVSGSLALVDAARFTALVAPDPNVPHRETCHELRDLASGRTLWRLCGPLLFRSFSADGAYLLATGHIDGLDESQLNPDGTSRYGGLVVIRTSDASIVLEGGIDDPGGVGSPVSYRMGDDERITVQVGSTTGDRDLQRCTLDGACEVVDVGRPRWNPDIPEGDDPYFLSAN
ncbi:hypothetical protein [Terracoccus sp. 273MFTsu3.1]|uniref:hypothetical protein n=1 Tax=Terracoccus sp. 273MFTsu3.1 TaxID=1172188 RepID=UPI0003616D3F|nr:hypothetical protein [Terracoccus sp. 273MFTsu3.1]